MSFSAIAAASLLSADAAELLLELRKAQAISTDMCQS